MADHDLGQLRHLSLCGADNLGGFWLWAEFDNDGTADATITGCGHLQGGGGFAGAGHLNVDAHSWTIAPGSAGPATFFITSETDTFVGHGTPQVVDIPSENMDTGVPAVPGHYTIAGQVFGFSGPGVTFQMQVVQPRRLRTARTRQGRTFGSSLAVGRIPQTLDRGASPTCRSLRNHDRKSVTETWEGGASSPFCLAPTIDAQRSAAFESIGLCAM